METDLERSDSSSEERFRKVDSLQQAIADNIGEFATIATINHARLADEEGVTMPPCVVTIYSDVSINTQLMGINPRIGLDLPQKILVYEESGRESITFATSDFLARRHGIHDLNVFRSYDAALATALIGLPEEMISPVGADNMAQDYGIFELTSSLPLDAACTRIQTAVLQQGDTVWFGQIDFQAEAAARCEAIPGATLLLFGGPKPGGMAMGQFPKLGLDAFCQKVLIYKEEDGNIKIIFNDIVALANLHYGSSNQVQDVINGRLLQTFEAAISS